MLPRKTHEYLFCVPDRKTNKQTKNVPGELGTSGDRQPAALRLWGTAESDSTTLVTACSWFPSSSAKYCRTNPFLYSRYHRAPRPRASAGSGPPKAVPQLLYSCERNEQLLQSGQRYKENVRLASVWTAARIPTTFKAVLGLLLAKTGATYRLHIQKCSTGLLPTQQQYTDKKQDTRYGLVVLVARNNSNRVSKKLLIIDSRELADRCVEIAARLDRHQDY